MSARVTVYYDYLCPFAWRGAELTLEVERALGVHFDWRHFSLYQNNHDRARRRSGGGSNGHWQLWNETIDEDDRDGVKGLLPFLASNAAACQGDALHDAFRLELLRSRHRDRRPLDGATVRDVARRVGLHMPRFERELANPEARTLLARDHHRAELRDVFGTPTFAFGDGHTAYVRLKDLPRDPGEIVELYEHLRGTLERYPYLETLKRPRQRNN